MTDKLAYKYLLRRNFADWLTDFTVFRFLLVLVILFSASKAFDSKNIDSVFWRIAYWCTQFTELYIFFGLVGAVITLITGNRFRGNLHYEMIASIIVPIFMGVVGRATLCWFTDTPITYEGIESTFLRYMATMPILVLCSNRVRLLVDTLADLRFERSGLHSALEVSTANGLVSSEFVWQEPPSNHNTGRQAAAVPISIGDVPLYAEAEDHYLKIVYPDRVKIIRSSLAAEARKWQGYGHQVHRSYWVSCEAITERVWSNRKLFIVLKTGERIPVGRTYEQEIIAKVKANIS